MTVFHRMRWWVALAVALLLAGSLIPSTRAQSSPLDDDEFQQAIMATNKLFILGPDGKPIGTCTGTTITPDGFILTNFHCVGHTDLYGEDDSGLGLAHGDLYNPRGLLVVAPTKSERAVPAPTYVAQFVSGDPRLDVAVIKIVGMLKEGQKLPSRLPLVPIRVADSDRVKTRDFVGVIGYPGVGGPTLTYTDGQISGFDDQDGDGEVESFKTTAEIAGGNSGGLAVNADGHQIGIPTYGQEQGASKVDRIKMVNAASAVIAEALGGSGGVEQQQQDQQQDAGVVLVGKIVDANTKRAVAGAMMIILKPGVTLATFEESGFADEYVAAMGTTDRRGTYQTAPGLPRGEVYSVVIGAKGYTPRSFEDALEITEDDPEVTEIEPIALEKR
ncbi:MAG: hypothetical protein RLZZ387_1419 [Chloroflexota bacterium]